MKLLNQIIYGIVFSGSLLALTACNDGLINNDPEKHSLVAETATATPTHTTQAATATPTHTTQAATATPTHTTQAATATPTHTTQATTATPTHTTQAATATPTHTTQAATATPTHIDQTATATPTHITQAENTSMDKSTLFLEGSEDRIAGETLAVLPNIWLCEKEVYVSDLTPTGSKNLRCSVTVEISKNTVTIKATGIPNHDFESTYGCCATEQKEIWYLPRFPKDTNETEYEDAPIRGAIAFTVSGVAIYGPEDGPGGDAVAHELGLYEEDRQPIDLGICGGHAGPGGQYHYHYDANCLHWHAKTSSTNYMFSEIDLSSHSPVLGFAFDGYAIYGSYGWDNDFHIKEMKSSYKLREGENGYGGISDYIYVPGFGDLDICNGHISPTPHSIAPIYHYHSTMHNAEDKNGFPYFPLCYHAVPDSRNIGNAGGNPPGGGPPNRRP